VANTEATPMAESDQSLTNASAAVLGAPAAKRRGPSGQELRGPEQKTQPVDVPTPSSINPLQTPAIEAENVHKVYNAIAEHWNHTRYKAWPRVDAFLRALPPASLVADLGCGNGKNVPAVLESGCFPIASDMSPPLVRITQDAHNVPVLVADCLCAPFRNGVFDAAISIAVLHHLSSEARRVQALREAARLLRPGGMFLVYCWSYEQDDQRSRSRHRFAAQDVLVPWNHRVPGVRKQRGQEETDDQQHGEQNGADGDSKWEGVPEVCQRYCHVYREGELQDLLAQVQELEVVEHYFDTGNWCAISRRRLD